MSNLRWTHVVVGFLIGVFVYTPARDSETFVLLMQAAVFPAVTLTGTWMWQQARLRGNPRRTRTNGPKPPARGSGPRVLTEQDRSSGLG